jgi:glycosyltransferase involved in cell wall biosynthesis
LIVACIPAFNEEKTIAQIILKTQKHVDTVIVCDDGSTDLTSEIAERLGAKVLRHEKNLGYGAALLSLFREAKDLNADIVVTLDADGQHNPTAIQDVIKPIIEDKADIVLGSRFLEKNNNIPSYRRFGIKLLTRMSNGSCEEEISDAQCGFRAYNRKAMQKLKLSEEGMGISTEILQRAGEQGLRIGEVSVQVTYKGVKTSTYHPLRHGLSVLATIIRLVVEERPLFYLGIPGAIMLIIGIGFGIWTVQLFTSVRYIVTNVALAAVTFTLIGTFTLFTAVTLYAIIRLTQKISAERGH